MVSRILVAFIGIPLVLGILISGDIARLVFFAVLACRGQFELFSMFSGGEPRHPFLEYFLGCGVLFLSLFWGEYGILLGISVSLIFLVTAIVIRGLNGGGYKRFSLGIVSILYLHVCMAFFLVIAREKGAMELLAVLTSIWALDIGAYFVGCTFQGPKLAPAISPNKTISGAVGGLLTCWGSFLTWNFSGFLQMPWQKLAGFAIITGILGQVADLFESVLKRESGVKDSGTLLGSHGGMLDRLDSILLLGPVSYFFLVR